MALFRSIPYEVDAVKYCGMKDEEPVFSYMNNGIPSWMWRGMTGGRLSFDSAGLKAYGKPVDEGAWLVFDGVGIDTMTDEKFNRTFSAARKPMAQMASAPKPLGERKTSAQVVEEAVAETAAEAMSNVPQEHNPHVDDAIPMNPYPGTTVSGIGTVAVHADQVDEIMTKLAQR